MKVLLKYKKFNNKNLKERIFYIIAMMMMVLCVIFTIIDIIEHFTNSEMGGAGTHHIAAKAIILDYLNYWSTWAMQFAGISALIIIIFNIYIIFSKNINLILAKRIFKIQSFSLVYLLFSAITYNISLFIGKNFNEASNFQSIIEHQLMPILFLIYMIISGNKIILKGKWYQSVIEFLSYLVVISIYPILYLSYAMIFGLHKGGYFGYDQINVTKIGWAKFWKNIFIALLIQIFLSFICYSPFTDINFWNHFNKINYLKKKELNKVKNNNF